MNLLAHYYLEIVMTATLTNGFIVRKTQPILPVVVDMAL